MGDVQNEDRSHYIRLSSRIDFDAVTKSGLNSVFFDEINSQVFSVLSGDVTEVRVQSLDPKLEPRKFSVEEKGRVISIKFSINQKILAVQRTQSSLELVAFDGDNKVWRKCEESFKGAVLLGFVWSEFSSEQILLCLTTSYAKLFKIETSGPTGIVTPLKTLNLNIKWFVYYPPRNLVGLSTGSSTSNSLQLITIKDSTLVKLTKLEVDIDSRTVKGIGERDVVVGLLYNVPRLLFLSYQTVNNRIQTEILVYTQEKNTFKKTHVLRIHETGRFALNIVDNLVIVHNQLCKTSSVFDITDFKFSGVEYLSPVVEPRSIEPSDCQLYSSNWITFQPNIIMDVKVGSLWCLELNLVGFSRAIQDKRSLVKFLLLRDGSLDIISRTISSIVEDPSRLEELGDIFDQINIIYLSYLTKVTKRRMLWSGANCDWAPDDEVEFKAVLDQKFIYDTVFHRLAEKVEPRELSWTLLEYIRSLSDFSIPAEHFIYELLINSLVLSKRFYQLHQLLQYHAVVDSKPLACLLLSLENLYPASSQLAIDMLHRLGNAKEEITEILLSQRQVLSALRYAETHAAPHDVIRPAKYIEAAKALGNVPLQQALEKYFAHNCKGANIFKGFASSAAR